LHDPNSILSFEENIVLLPIEVIDEIDSFKHENTDRGRNAREASRIIDGLRKLGRLSEGVGLPNGGTFRILLDFNGHKKPTTRKEKRKGHNSNVLNSNIADYRILKSALRLKEEANKSNTDTILVTKDLNLRIRADALGLKVEDYETGRVPLENLFSGLFDLEISETELLAAQREGVFELKSPHDVNKYCMLFCNGHPSKKVRQIYMRVDKSGRRMNRIIPAYDGVWGIVPRNREQHFAMDALLDDSVKLVTLMGKAGTGKTLLAMAAGLKRTIADSEYGRVIVARPTVSVGKEIGFLPGTLEEKLNPWMQPIHDALELLSDLNSKDSKKTRADLMRSGAVVVEALSYIRGRSIANQYMIIDEAQNLTPLEVKTIVTRVGQGTKLVFTGDPYQIDNPYVDSSSNGFNYIINRFRGQPIAAHVELQKGERSELAELAANLL
jgi:PhoH-like ATPase